LFVVCQGISFYHGCNIDLCKVIKAAQKRSKLNRFLTVVLLEYTQNACTMKHIGKWFEISILALKNSNTKALNELRGRGRGDMEKSLPNISLRSKKSLGEDSQESFKGCSQESFKECSQGQEPPQSTSNPWQGDGYDTRLMPHISLPQRQRQAIGKPQPAGLLHYTASTARDDSGPTVGMDAYGWARNSAKQVQATPPIKPIVPASISYTAPMPSITFKQQYMQEQQAGAQRYMPPPAQIVNLSDEPHVGTEQLRDIKQARTRVVIKAIVTSGLFAGVGCVIWTLFSGNSIYLIVMFLILAVMLGSILSTSMSDYYQLGLNKLGTTLQLRALDSPKTSDAMHGIRAPHLRVHDDTSGYLDALKKTFSRAKERRLHM
jgi:hypothetical protein